MEKMIKLKQEIQERMEKVGKDGQALFNIVNEKINKMDTLPGIKEAGEESKLYSKGEIKELIKMPELINKASQKLSNAIIMYYMDLVTTANRADLDETIDIQLHALHTLKEFSSEELEMICPDAKKDLGEKFDEIMLMVLDCFIKAIEDTKSLLKEKIR